MTIFEFFVRDVAPKIKTLENKDNILALKPDGVSNRKPPFYHPEIHNEVRMAFSHVARYEVLNNEIPVEGFIEQEEFIEAINNAINAEKKKSNKTKPEPNQKQKDAHSQELFKADSHIQRANMDADKLAYLNARRRNEQFKKTHRMDYLSTVDSSNFYKELTTHENNALEAYQKAAVLEALGFHMEASAEYGLAATHMKTALSYLNDKEKSITTTNNRMLISRLAMIVMMVIDAVITIWTMF